MSFLASFGLLKSMTTLEVALVGTLYGSQLMYPIVCTLLQCFHLLSADCADAGLRF